MSDRDDNGLLARVRSVTYEAKGINSWELVPLSGSFPSFSPGAHIDLHLPNRLVRSYSLVNPSGERSRYVIAVARDRASRGGSAYIHERLKPGDVVTVSMPRNNFELIEDARHVVFIAGGIGITPMRCMLHRLDELGRSWELHYSVRTRDACAFREELECLERRRPGHIHLNFDHEPGGAVLNIAAIIGHATEDTYFYCCGPSGMLKACQAAAAGVASDRIRVEYFSSDQGAAVGGGYFVEAARSNKRLEVIPGKSILDTLLEADIQVPFACRQGICGTCELKVLSGVPDHRDSVLNDQEHAASETMMVCCSGSMTETLVLDI